LLAAELLSNIFVIEVYEIKESKEGVEYHRAPLDVILPGPIPAWQPRRS
jgi:hypothetical protein